MGFFNNMAKGYDKFRQGQLERKKKELAYLKQKAAISTEEAQYKAQINAAKKSNAEGFNNRVNAFNEMINGKPEPGEKRKRPGEELGRWF